MTLKYFQGQLLMKNLEIYIMQKVVTKIRSDKCLFLGIMSHKTYKTDCNQNDKLF